MKIIDFKILLQKLFYIILVFVINLTSILAGLVIGLKINNVVVRHHFFYLFLTFSDNFHTIILYLNLLGVIYIFWYFGKMFLSLVLKFLYKWEIDFNKRVINSNRVIFSKLSISFFIGFLISIFQFSMLITSNLVFGVRYPRNFYVFLVIILTLFQSPFFIPIIYFAIKNIEVELDGKFMEFLSFLFFVGTFSFFYIFQIFSPSCYGIGKLLLIIVIFVYYLIWFILINIVKRFIYGSKMAVNKE